MQLQAVLQNGVVAGYTATLPNGDVVFFPPDHPDVIAWLAEGNVPLPPASTLGADYTAREREEAETALVWAKDDTAKIAALARLTIGGS
jgi:hypothetical protein